MVKTYPSVYTTRGELVTGLKQLTDEYKLMSATEADIRDVLTLWRKNCPNLLLDIEGGKPDELAPRVKKLIGAKRSVMIQTMLDSLPEQ